MNGIIKRTVETTLDVVPEYPLSELERLAPLLSRINVLSASVAGNGELLCGEDERPAAFAAERDIPAMLTVSCGEAKYARRLFTDEDAESRFFEKLAERLATGNFAGANFEFLNLFPFDRSNYTEFLKKAAAVLHENACLAGSIAAPPCALSLAAANDYEAQGEYLDSVNILLSGCLYLRNSPCRRMADDALAETLAFAGKAVPGHKLAVTLSDHALAYTENGVCQVLPAALVRSISAPNSEFDGERDYARLFDIIAAYPVSDISIRSYSRTDKMIFDVIADKFDIIRP